MVWLIEKKVVYHHLDLGFETVEIPVRVKFEFEIKQGVLVPDTLSTRTLYNRKALEKQYPGADILSVEASIQATVRKEIRQYMQEGGFLSGKGKFC
jgi:hypothetical protein